MKQTKKFLTRMLTILLVVMTLFSTMSVGFTASAATVDGPEEYTETYDLGATPDEAPKGETVVETPEKKPEEPEDADSSQGNVEVVTPIRPNKQDIADVGANVDVAGTGWNQSSCTVYFEVPSGWTIGTIQLLIGHGSWSSCYTLSKDSGRIYKCSVPSWDGATEWYFINTSGSWGDEGNSPTHRKDYATNASSKRTSALTAGTLYTSSGTKTFTVTFKDYDGTVLKTQSSIKYKGSATAPSNPSRASTAQYSYTFAGWDKSYSSITADTTVTATYTSTVRSYTVTFKDYDGTTLKTQSVKYGSAATAPANPSRASTAQYSYTFAGWDKSFSNITGALTVTATYTSTVRSYTVKFVDWDGTQLKSQSVKYGSAATAPADPSRASTAQYSYTFTGWDKSFSNITGALTVTAQYSSTVRSYTVKFVDWDGTQLKSQSVKYGSGATAPSNPTRTGYTFSKWDKSYSNITGNLTVTAVYTINSYTVTFKDDSAVGGGTLKTQTVNYGSAATAPTVSPKNGWEFYSWDKDFSNITGNTTVTAVRSNKNVQLLGDGNIGGWTVADARRMTYNSDGTSTKTVTLPAGRYELKIYTEEWGNWLGNSGTVNDSCSGWDMGGGNNLVLNASGGKYTFTFNRNTSKLSISFTAVKYTVTMKAGTGGTASADYTSVNLGGTTTITAKPSKGYHFTGWTIGSNASGGSTSSASTTITVNGDVTCTANFAGNVGTVTYKAGSNGKIEGAGGSVTYPNAATSKATANTGYSFSKWTVTGGTQGTDWDFTTGDTSTASIGIKVYTAGKTITAEASFTANKRTINFTAGTGGTVTAAGGSVTYPNTTSSTAKPNTGYHFTGWTVSGGTAGTDYKITSGSVNSASSTSLTVQPLKSGTTNFTANFQINSYTVTFKDHDGTVLKTQTVTHGSGATAPSNPSRTGYTFSKWDKSYSNITADTTITAVYTINNYDVTLTKTPSAGGTVSSNDYTVDYNKTCTITATPNEGYSFVKWEITSGTGSLANANSASTTLTVTSDITVRATFDIAVYTVNFRDHADFGGEIVNTQYIEHGSNATAPSSSLIKPEGGWEFYSWGEASAYQNVKKDLNIYAVRSNKNVHILGDVVGGVWSANNDNLMTYNTNGTNTKTIKLPKGTYELKIFLEDHEQWKGNNGTVVDTTDTTASAGWDMDGGNNLKLQASGGNYTFTYYRNTNKLKITYSPITYSVSTAVSPSAGGTTTITQTSVHYGDTTTLKATAKPGYTFSKWTFTGSPSIEEGSATSATVTIMPSQATTATAVFTANEATVKYASTSGGSVTKMGENSVTYPGEVKSTATANPGYTFSGWTVTGGTKGTDWDFATGDANSATIGIKVYKKGATITATANFTANSATVKFVAGEGGTVTNAGNNTVAYPGKKASTATAAASHDFAGWTITGGTLNTDYKITAGGTDSTNIEIQPITGKTITATANFTIKKYTVTFKNWDGSNIKSVLVEHGSAATPPTTPTRPSTAQYSFTFKAWDKDFSNITSDLIVTATYTQSIRSYTVKFVDYNGSVLKSDTVEYGKGATAPADPSRTDGFIFDGWDKAYNNITGDLTVTAKYWDNNVYLVGVTGSWDQNNTTKMTYGTTSSMTLTLNEGNYEFKFIYKGYWQGNGGEVVNTTDINGSSNPWQTYGDSSNIRLKAIGGTYKFTFNKDTWQFEIKHTPITYTVKFYNGDTLLKTETVKRGENATAPANPTKAADAEYTYTFKGWDTNFTGVRQNLTVKAEYTATKNKYVVTFKNHDGSVIATQNVEYGSAATAPATPTREGYTFTGWDKDFSMITGALTVTAQYSINTYKVTFVNWNGAVLKEDNVTYGSGATAPATPTRPADAQYTYTFKGWDKSFSKITGPTTITATYTQTVNTYTVTFQNYDGHVYKTQTVEYGKAATAPSNPSRNDGWKFIGWDKGYSNITGDLTVTAQWEDDNVYLMGVTGTWDKTDSTLSKIKMSYASTAVMSLKLDAGNYEFKFIYKDTWLTNTGTVTDTTNNNGNSNPWETYQADPNIKLTASGGTYTFKFNKSTQRFEVLFISNAKTVTFKNDDGSVLATAMVEKGKTADSVAPANPTKNSTAQYTYTFAGWTPDINTTVISEDTVFTATYTPTINQYTVTFVDWNDAVLGTSTVDYGTGATAPAVPSRPADAQYTYAFKGWSADYSNVTGNMTVKAEYTATVNKYEVTFKYYTADGKTEKTEKQSVEYGKAATAPTVPARTDGWTFTGWDVDFHNITANLVVTAKYRNDNIYLVIGPSNSDQGWNTHTMSLSGDIATYSVALVPGTYGFKLNQDVVWYGNWGTIDDTTDTTSANGWDMNADAGNCTLNASGGTYTFTFNNSTKKLIVKYVPTTYWVTFKDHDGTELKKEEVAIGKSATAPADPTRESTVSHDYEFTGWDKDFKSVTSDMTITAVYKETLRKYTVTFNFKDADGKDVTETQQVEYGKSATAPTLPLRPDGQALRKWLADYSNITGDLTVEAEYFDDNVYLVGSFNDAQWTYRETLQTYGNKTVSKRVELKEGTYEFKFIHDGKYYSNEYAGTVEDTTGNNWWATNTEQADNTKIKATGGWYTFTWNTDTNAFQVAYEPYMYTVTFVDHDNKVLDTQTVAIGTAAKAPATPTRNDGWVFDKWDTDFSSVKSDLTVKAEYYDNNIYLMGINGNWSTTDANNRLTNKGTENVVELTIDIGKTAGDTFTQSQHEFKFKQHNTWYTYRPTSGSSKVIADSTMGNWYDTDNSDGNTILKASGGKYTFRFAVDTKDFYIHYDAIQYEVIFYDYALNVLKREMVDIGKGATAPDVPTRSNGFKFLKWDKDFSRITDRTEVYARYYDDKMYISGDFNNWGTTALGTYGDKIQSTTLVLEPGSYDFAFFHNEPVNGEAVRHYHTDINNGTFENETTSDNDGWWNTKKADGGHTTITSTGGIYTFHYNTETHQFKVTYTPNVFDVTFVYYDADGNLVEEVQDVKLGEAAVLPEVPVRKDGWVFRAWDSDDNTENGDQTEYTNVTRDLTVYARYIDENVYFTAEFNNWNEKATPFSLTEDENIVKLTLEFTTREYEFKLHHGDGWYGYDGTITDETASAVQMSNTAGNAVLNATGGYYTFTFNKASKTLEVSYEPYVYTVTFVDYDNTVLKTEEVAITKGATAPEDPTRSDGFVFTGWDKMFDNIQSDLTVKAQYRDDNVYLMGIDNDWTNGKVMTFSEDSNLATYTIRNVSTYTEYAFKFLYEGVWYTDINAGTADNSTGDSWWSTTDDQSVGNTKLTASGGSYVITFNKTDKTFKIDHKPNIYHVTFHYYGKTHLEPITTIVAVEAGGDVELPVLETRTDEWFYLFWAENVNGEPYGTRYRQTITNVTQDMEIQAWYYDDNAYLVGEVVDGVWGRTKVVDNSGNVIGGNIMEDYNFEAGTSTKVVHLDHGQYEFKVIHRHDEGMKDYMYGNNGTVYNTCSNWDMSTAANNVVLNASGGTYTFIFDRFTKRLTINYVPDFYEVTFVDYDGTIIDTQTVQSGQAATAPEIDELRDGYMKFGGWDKSFDEVYSDLTVTAQYYDDNYYLKGSFNNWGTTHPMGAYGDETVVTGIYLEPGTYTFKINHMTGVNVHEWFGSNQVIADSTLGLVMNVDADCTLNATGGYYTFKYTPSTNTLVIEYDATEFTVIFKDWNGTVLDTQTVMRGKAAIAPAEPTREGDVQYSYIFSGWSEDFSDVQSNMEITAVYTQVTNKYDVTFVDHNNEVIAVVPTEYGTAAVAPSVPARPDGWVFSHWDKDFSNITGKLTVQAQYINGNVFLAGTFNDWNETTLPMEPTGNANEFATTIILHHGLTNQFKIKVGDGWFGNIGTFTDTTDEDGKSNPWLMEQTGSLEGNTTINSTGGYYTFIYNIVTQRLEVKYDPFVYTVNFYDYNDVLLKTEQVEITKSATPPEAPTRGGGFTFKGWDPDYSRVMSDLDVYAKYYDDNLYLKGSFNEWGTENVFTKYGDKVVTTTVELEPGTYTFKMFKETEDGGELWYSAPSETIVDSTDWKQSYDAANLGDTILIANGGYYTFTFNHETKEFKIDYKPYEYDVTFVFKAEDGVTDVKVTQTVARGQSATAPALPFRPDGFEFAGWDKEFSYITEDITVTADYFDNNLYLVGSFNNWEKTDKLTVYGNQEVSTRVELAPGQYEFKFLRNGIYYTDFESATFNDKTASPEATKTDGANTKLNATGGWYTFTFNNNSEQFTIAYEPYVYTVNFIDHDGTVLKSEEVEISKDATAPTDPTREHYNFTGWDKQYTNVQGNLDVYAQYEIHTFKVTFVYKDADGETDVEVTQTVDYGSAAKAPELPRRMDGWVFSYWDKDFSFITEDITVTAEYIDDNVYLVGDFNNWNVTSHPMKLTENEDIVKITIRLDDKNLNDTNPYGYEFKLKRGDDWFTNTGEIPNTTDVNGNSNPWDMVTSGDNCTLLVQGGDYTFIYNKATQELEVKYAPYTYVVTFKNWDGTILDTQTVQIGKDATPPAPPTKPDVGNIVYKFSGWDEDFTNVTKDITVTAQFTESTRQLTVTFVDHNGTVLKTQLVDKGQDATAPEIPTREGDAQYSYEFSGWDKDFKNVQEDLTVTATYLQITNKYKVTFVDYNDKVLETQEVEYGKSAIAPADPSRGDNFYFTGWKGDFSKVTEDITVKATYADNKIYLKGDFNNWDISTVMWKTGENTYTAVLDDLAKGTYKFKINHRETIWYGNGGTFNDTTDINGVSNPWTTTTEDGDQFNSTIVATGGKYTFIFYSDTKTFEVKYELPEYTVTFQDWDGNILKTETVQRGQSATAPEVPAAPEGFKFSGWDTEFSFVTENTVVTAQLAELGTQYTVIFKDWNGAIIKVHGNDEQLVDAGTAAEAPVYGVDFKRDDTQEYEYTFNGWDQEFTQVNKDMEITAVYVTTPKKYTVTFVDWDETLLRIEQVEYGKSATAPEEPTRPGYYFTGWDKDFTNITESITVNAQYAESNEIFTVKFWNFDGSVLLDTVTVMAGQAAKAPNAPERSDTAEFDYTFTGWSEDFSNVLSNMDVYAQYSATKKVYTVTYKDYDGSIIKTENVEYGGAGTPPEATYSYTDGGRYYTFKGWDPYPSKVTGNMTVKAQYKYVLMTYTVKFEVNSTIISTQKIEHGRTPIVPSKDDSIITNELNPGEVFEFWTKYGAKVDDFRIYGDTTFKASIKNATVYIYGGFTGWLDVAMTQSDDNDNVYYHYINNLPADTHEFKFRYQGDAYGDGGVIQDSTNGWWGPASTSADNIELVATGGRYKFEFNRQTKKYQVTYEAPKYTVTFVDYDGSVISTQEVEKGKPAIAPPSPSRPSDENGYSYTFVDWDQPFNKVETDMIITARYSSALNTYAVTFVDWDGSEISVQMIEHGSSAIAPADPTRNNYQFTGWKGDFTNVKGNQTITAQYVGNLYTITAKAEPSQGGTATTNKPSVNYSDDDKSWVTLTATKTGEYNFRRWSIEGYFEIIEGSMTSSTLVIRPNSNITATAVFGLGVELTVHSYSESGYNHLYITESNGTTTNYPAGNYPGTKQPIESDFSGVKWLTSNELAMTNGYSSSVIAQLTNGLSSVPGGSDNLIVFNNTLGWTNVYLYTKNSTMWNGDNGASTNGATRYNMTHISGTNYWYAYVTDTAAMLFIKEIQDSYNNIYNTSACYRTDYDSSRPTFTPSTTSNETRNGTVYYSNGELSGTPELGRHSANIALQNILYKNGAWAGVNEVWIYEGTTTIVTQRRELLGMLEYMSGTYNNGVNTENYTVDTWTNFVQAYELAYIYSGNSTSTQGDIDFVQNALQAAYDALRKQTYLTVVVTQTGGIGTVIVNDTSIATQNGSAQIGVNSNASVSVTAPENYYITGIVVNGDAEFTNSNQTITAKAITLKEVSENVLIEVMYEHKLPCTITVRPYDETAGTLYYGDRVLSPEGDSITVFAGDSATITAVPNENYAVGKWIIDQSGEFFKESYTFTGVKENHEIAIEWQELREITVTIAADPNAAGVATAVSGDNTAKSNGTATMKISQFETVTLTATVSDPCYKFAGWNIDGNYYAADNTTNADEIFNIVATDDIEVTATYLEVYRKIYLRNSANWAQPYLYFWGSSIETDTWPGTKMVFDSTIGDEGGYWVGYIPKDTTDIQFNDGTNQNQVEFDDVTPNLYDNGNKENTGTVVEPGYYLQGYWNDANHSAFDLEKFTENADGTYSITITVTSTGDGYIYVNPTNELSHFWNAEFNGNTNNPQTLIPLGQYTDAPNYVKVEIDTEDFDADYEVTFTFDPDNVSDMDGNFWWTTTPTIPTISVIGTDGRGTNSADGSMVTANNRVGKTSFDKETVVKVTPGFSGVHVVAAVIEGTPVTFSTQVNKNAFGTYDYYVYGWVINGTEFVYATNMGNGLYTGTYIFTEDNSTVVPVYFHTNEWLAANNVKHVTVYAVADKSIENWDKYFSAYTWYNNSNNETKYEQFGSYPGQLMIPIAGLDGVYYTFIEVTSPDAIHVSGITFANYADSDYIDTVVNDSVDGYTALQTYDYYDFVALLEDECENITFVIKNTNDKYNSDRLSGTNSVKLSDYQFVQYTDYSGLKSDIFGNSIEAIDATLSDENALYIIQAGNKSLHEGVLNGDHYVQCFIYDATGKYLGVCYSYELHDKDSSLWKGILAPYKNQRAYFSYEAMNGNRYDGEWYGDADISVKVNVSVNVGLTTNGGKDFTVNTTDPVNEAKYGVGYIEKEYQNYDVMRGAKFTLTAKPGKGYRFVGWYSQNGQLFSTNISYVATSAVGATYTAVFEELDKNNFYVNHYLYTGVGTTSSYIPKPHDGKAQLYVGIENITMGEITPLALAESAYVQARVGDELIITIATDAIGADKFFAWYVEAKDKFGLTSFEEVGVDSWDNLASRTDDLKLPYDFERYLNNGTVIGRNDMVYFQFAYTVKKDTNGEMINSMTLYSDLVPISVDVTLEYQYNDRNGDVKSYYVPYTLTYEEILGFAGNNNTPYTPAYISGEGWINTVLANAPFIDDFRKDTTWVINKAMYDTMTFVLWATQTDTLFTVTTQIGDTVIINQVLYNEVLTLDIRDIIPDIESIDGFWYNDLNNNGAYDAGVDLILTYGPRYGYRVTGAMNINYHNTTEELDFNITTDEPVYGRYQTSNADGSNKVDKVTVDYVVNILTPFGFDGKEFIPDKSLGEEMSMHVTIRALRAAGYEINYGVILEQVGSFAPGSAAYPTFDDALKAAEAKNYGKATDSSVLTNEVLNGYTKPVMTSKGTYCTVYSAEHIPLTNKNRYQFALEFNNTAANQKKFFNVYSYITVKAPEGEATTYISNVQTLNIYNTGIASVVE